MNATIYRIGHDNFRRIFGAVELVSADEIFRWVRDQHRAYCAECADVSFGDWLLDRYPMEVSK